MATPRRAAYSKQNSYHMNHTHSEVTEAAAKRLLRESLKSKTPSDFKPQEIQQDDVSAASSADSISEDVDPCLKRILESARLRRPGVHAISRASIGEWCDKQPGPMKTIQLRHLPQKELLDLARKTFQDIHGNISQRTIGSLLVLAYNIMNAQGEYLTAEPCEDLIDITSRITLKELSDEDAYKGSGKAITEIGKHPGENDDKLLCMVYTYLAASYLRLFTKSAENYLKIESHLNKKFSSFYGEALDLGGYGFSFPLENFHPDLNTIKFIRRQFELQDIYRNTFYVFLYASCENKLGEHLKYFLYIMHVSYSGLHPFMLFVRAANAFHTDHITLARIMYSEEFGVELQAIMDVFTKFVNPNDGNDLHMWRFGRIIDRRFLGVLQTKKCVFFTLVLAYILKIEESRDKSEGVLEISQIKIAKESDRVVAYAYALRVVILVNIINHRCNPLWPNEEELIEIYLK